MKSSLRISIASSLLLFGFILSSIETRADRPPGIRAAAAERDITPPVGMEILHYFRNNIGVFDPLFLRTLLLEDEQGTSFALITADLICAGFAASDDLRARVKKETGVTEVWLNCSHSHSSRWLCANHPSGTPWTDEQRWDDYRDRPISEVPAEAKWNQMVFDAAVEIVTEAKEKLEPATLHVGRETVQVGFNRRLLDENGYTYMGVNRTGVVVPWVNVLTARSRANDEAIAVLFEHASHPVTVPHTSKLVSADFPGAAVARIRERLGNEVVALFGQGCSGNINSYPLRSTHKDAVKAGNLLGDAVLKAMDSSTVIKAKEITVRHRQILLPTRPLPTAAAIAELKSQNQDNPDRLKQLNTIEAFQRAKRTPPPRRFDVNAMMLGNEWCLAAMSYETFAEYELWIDQEAPFQHTMTLSLTNGGRAYIGTDAALAMGPKGGYEAGCLPSWSGHETMSPHLGPPAVGAEKRIQEAFKSLWR